MDMLNQLSIYFEEAKSTILCTPTWQSIKVYSIYYLYICIGSIIIPATKVKGHSNPKRGPQLQYSINGFRLTCLSIIIMLIFGGVFSELQKFKLFKLTLFVDNFWSIWSTVNLFAIVVSIFLYIKGAIGKSFIGQIEDKYTHGNFFLDFWVGKQLNPRLGTFDIKFCAYKVGMIFWLVLNLSFLAKQNELGVITWRMICYQFTTGFYILDYFWNQPKMLTTWDIISQQFGYMLVFGDYVFIPFVFSIQAHYLLNYPDFNQNWIIGIILILFFIGFYIFRVANSQKDQFKINPNNQIWGKKPETIGGKLLVSGFWGICRHMNYTGDLIMALSYGLPCGAQLIGYSYLIYLFILLVHRAYRDDAKCRQKYSNIWDEYCKKVKYVFVPFYPIDIIMQSIGKAEYFLTNSGDTKKKQN